MMRSRLFLVSLTAVVTIGVAHPVVADTTANERAERVRALRRQVEQNDAQIRVLEQTVRRLQAGKPGAGAPKPATVSAQQLGEISAWSTGGPTAPGTAPVAPQPSPAPAVVTPAVPRPVDRGRSTSTALHGAKRAKSRLAAASLRVGMSQVTVWDVLGPPEFVRGRRTEVQYWHYGADWIRFQGGRITRWEEGSPQISAAPSESKTP